MTIPDFDHRLPKRRWLPAAAGVAVIVVLTAAVIMPRLGADAAVSVASTATSLTAEAVPRSANSSAPRACRAPQPLTLPQLAALARAPIQPPATLSAASPARPHLRSVIRDLTDAACDTATGRYAYTQVRQWATNTSSSGGVTTLDVQVWQYQRWAAEDNSGRTVTLTQPAEEQARTDESYRPGELLVRIVRLPTDPGLLAALFNDSQPFANGPQSPLRAWAEINAWYSPNRAQRAAALAVFRDTDGIQFNGTTRDRTGRTGIALSVTSDHGITRDLLILDEHTGELLAYEMAAMRDPGRLHITQPTVLDYKLFLAHTHTATTRQP